MNFGPSAWRGEGSAGSFADAGGLMDKVSLSRQGKPLTQMVNDLLFRIEHVDREKKAAAFVVMHHHGDEMAERQLSQIEKYAYTVDVGEEEAASTIGPILGVPLLPESLIRPQVVKRS
jgi:hypothetical protein